MPHLRAAVVGAGPSGFYAVDALQRQRETEVQIDLFDRLPTPYGLVRSGVAPDHQSVKRVSESYERCAMEESFRFFGNVTLGRDLSAAELKARYDAVIYAVGGEGGRRLGLPGEALEGVHTATELVFWYNGHPDSAGRRFELERARRVVVVGNGNVAMDVARVLSRDPEELAGTDIAHHALQSLRSSAVEEVLLLGRRGPAQAAFSPRAISELAELSGADLVISPRDVALDPAMERWLGGEEAPASARLSVEILRARSLAGEGTRPRKIRCWFQVSPLEFVGAHGRLTHIRLVRNRLVERGGDWVAEPSGESWLEPVEQVFQAVGYRGIPIPGVPFDPEAGIIPNREGRVWDPEREQIRPGEYVVGWAKRGPVGLIGANRPEARAVVERLLEDRAGGVLAPGEGGVEALLEERGVRRVSFPEWLKIDAEELRRGVARGKIREKFVSVAEMLAALDGSR